MLLDRLESDRQLRRICGWERKHDVPGESTFSRTFADFAESDLAGRVHEALIRKSDAGEIVGHISRDSTAIDAREKPLKKPKPSTADSAYDAEQINAHSRELGHVPLIDINSFRNKELKEKLKNEGKRRKIANYQIPEDQRRRRRETEQTADKMS